MSLIVAEVVEEQNVALIDSWTPVHVGVGVGAGLLGINSGLFALGLIAYEVIEYTSEYPDGNWLFASKRPESLGNATTDVVAGLVGYYAGRLLRRVATG